MRVPRWVWVVTVIAGLIPPIYLTAVGGYSELSSLGNLLAMGVDGLINAAIYFVIAMVVDRLVALGRRAFGRAGKKNKPHKAAPPQKGESEVVEQPNDVHSKLSGTGPTAAFLDDRGEEDAAVLRLKERLVAVEQKIEEEEEERRRAEDLEQLQAQLEEAEVRLAELRAKKQVKKVLKSGCTRCGKFIPIPSDYCPLCFAVQTNQDKRDVTYWCGECDKILGKHEDTCVFCGAVFEKAV